MLRIRRDRKGGYVVSVPSAEAALLRSLPQRLREVLERPDFKSSIVRRLFPPAYSDEDKEAEYRELVGNDLLQRKLDSVATFERTFEAGRRRLTRFEVAIDDADFELWLGFVNDMRLVLGTELDIRDDHWGETFDPHHPRAHDFALLYYLGWLEEELLRAAGADRDG